MPGAVVAVEFIAFAELLEFSFGAVDLIGMRIFIVVAENSKQRAGQFFRQLDWSHRSLGVQGLRIVHDHVAAPAIDRCIDTRNRAGGEKTVSAAGAKADRPDFAV